MLVVLLVPQVHELSSPVSLVVPQVRELSSPFLPVLQVHEIVFLSLLCHGHSDVVVPLLPMLLPLHQQAQRPRWLLARLLIFWQLVRTRVEPELALLRRAYALLLSALQVLLPPPGLPSPPRLVPPVPSPAVLSPHDGALIGVAFPVDAVRILPLW